MITLPIMFMTENQGALDELGIEQDFTHENTDIREVTFYNINFVYRSLSHPYTIIGSNGETFCCPKPVNEVINLINQNL